MATQGVRLSKLRPTNLGLRLSAYCLTPDSWRLAQPHYKGLGASRSETKTNRPRNRDLVAIGAPVGRPEHCPTARAVAVISSPNPGVYPPAGWVEVGGIKPAPAGIDVGAARFEINPGMRVAAE